MSLRERRREKEARKMDEKIVKKKAEIENNRTGQPAQSSKDEETRDNVRDFTSWRTTLKKSIPQIFLGLVLAYVEYRLIGPIFTVGSLAIYIPIVFFYSKSLREARGKYLLLIDKESGQVKILRYLVPEELWDLISFDHPLVPGMVEFNGRETFIATKVWTLPGSDIIYRVKLAWLHFNQLEYARNSGVLEKAIAFATNLALENTEVERTKELLSVMEGKRQAKEQFTMIDRANHEDPSVLRERVRQSEDKISRLVKANEDLLFGPEGEEKEEEENE